MKRVSRGGTDIRRTETHKLVAREFKRYKDVGLLPLLDKLAFGQPLILKGQKGAGKTLGVEQWAHKNGLAFLRKSCTGKTSDRHLTGGFVFKSLEESYFVLGVLSKAIDVANETGACVLVLEEINALDEEAQKVLNSVADFRQEVDIHHIGEVYRLNEGILAPKEGEILSIEPYDDHSTEIVIIYSDEDEANEYVVPTRCLPPVGLSAGGRIRRGEVIARPCRLWIIGTMNPDYGGTYRLNEDFRSRFQFIQMDFMDEEAERELLLAELPQETAEGKRFVRGLQGLSRETRSGKLGYALSTRDLIQCIDSYNRLGSTALALKLLEGKFDGRYVPDFQARVRSGFRPAVDLTKVKLL